MTEAANTAGSWLLLTSLEGPALSAILDVAVHV